MATEPSAEFTLRVSGDTLRLVNQLAAQGEMPRSDIVQTLLDLAFDRLVHALDMAGPLYDQGVPDDVVCASIKEAIAPRSIPYRRPIHDQEKG